MNVCQRTILLPNLLLLVSLGVSCSSPGICTGDDPVIVPEETIAQIRKEMLALEPTDTGDDCSPWTAFARF